MLSVAEALAAVLREARALPPRSVPLAEALGLVLVEPIVADIDLPPFDKALMDGFAVRSADCPGPGPHRLSLGEEILAGREPTRPLAPGEAAAIMTGAPLPRGADAVVMHERTEPSGTGMVLIRGAVRPGDARLDRGREMKAGDRLFEEGTPLDSAKLGVIASAGREGVLVVPRARAVIVPTGDELVSPGRRPGPGQIRETNSVVLAALVRSCGAEAIALPPAPDEPQALRQALARALDLRPDVLIVCGGVSAGKKDLVPDALVSLGVRPVFHKVRLKPGKPLLFGIGPETGPAPLVFGLPGNPVSGIVGFLLFLAPALQRLMGHPGDPRIEEIPGRLAKPFEHRGDRPTFHPGLFRARTPEPEFEPLDWAGSADLRTVARAHGFIRFPEGDRDYQAGDPVGFLRLP